MRDVRLLIMMVLLAGLASCAEELGEREEAVTESLALEGEQDAVEKANQKNEDFLARFASAVAESPTLGTAMQTASSEMAPGLQVAAGVRTSEDESMCRDGAPNSEAEPAPVVAMVKSSHASSVPLRERVLRIRASDLGPAQVAPELGSLEETGSELNDVKFGPFTY